MWPNALAPASVRVAASAAQREMQSVTLAGGFVYIKIWSLREAAGRRADSHMTSKQDIFKTST